MNIFTNRPLVIATKHQKETVITPVLERELGVSCFIAENFDTDELGTFTGEVERTLDPLATVREKCLRAMHANNCSLGVASEGSFGPHPAMFFINADDELLIFIDKDNNLEIVVRELSTDTNFNGQDITTENELLAFAAKVGFPSHALILRQFKNSPTHIYKGIANKEELISRYKQIINEFGAAYVETDMRAMFNPTRMKVIETAIIKLVNKILSTCPSCQTPGFDITDAKPGLPCSLCGSPTKSTLSYLYSCLKCGFIKQEMYPNNKQEEDPTFCDYCNP